MSYEPEILVSTEWDVLKEFRSSDTHAVCWDASGDGEFQELVDNVDQVNALTCDMPEIDRSELHKIYERAAELLQSNLSYAERMISRLPEITAMAAESSSQSMGLRMRHPGRAPSDSSMPHVDDGSFAVFLSFNKYADPTSCIPREFVGIRKNGYDFPDADVRRAITFPRASLYIIDLGQQVHFASQDVVPDKWRVLARAWLSYERG